MSGEISLDESASEKVLVLGGDPARYWRLGRHALTLLQELARTPHGVTVAQARDRHSYVDIDRMVTVGLLRYVPPNGLPVSPPLVLEMWRRNLHARARLARDGWDALSRAMTAVAQTPGPSTCVRPMVFDQIEAAARLSFGLPGTTRKCTAVAMATFAALRSRRYPARIVILGVRDQHFMHARSVVNDEPVDPNDELLEGDLFEPIGWAWDISDLDQVSCPTC